MKLAKPRKFSINDKVPHDLIDAMNGELARLNFGYCYSDLLNVKVNHENGDKHEVMTVEEAGYYLKYLKHQTGRVRTVKEFKKKIK